jgi:hypothetical protein
MAFLLFRFPLASFFSFSFSIGFVSLCELSSRSVSDPVHEHDGSESSVCYRRPLPSLLPAVFIVILLMTRWIYCRRALEDDDNLAIVAYVNDLKRGWTGCWGGGGMMADDGEQLYWKTRWKERGKESWRKKHIARLRLASAVCCLQCVSCVWVR